MHPGTPRCVSSEHLSHRRTSAAVRRAARPGPARQAQSDSVMACVAIFRASALTHRTLRNARSHSTPSRSVRSCLPGNAAPPSDWTRQPSEQLDGSPSPGHGSPLGCVRGALGRPFPVFEHDDSNFRRASAIKGIRKLENADGTRFSGFGFESCSWLEKPGGRMSSDDAEACLLPGSAARHRAGFGPNCCA